MRSPYNPPGRGPPTGSADAAPSDHPDGDLFRFLTRAPGLPSHLNPLSQAQQEFQEEREGSAGDGHSLTPSPTELNTKSYGNFIKVSPSKRIVTYVGTGRHSNDVGAIQSDHPVPTSKLIYYFEIKVLDAGRSGCIAIGFTDASAKLSRQPGWEANSYGYHGDDGQKYHNCGKGEDYGPTFTTGDIVGAGIHLGKGHVFFTKNGQSLGVAFPLASISNMYPTIGLHSKGEKVDVNFGDSPFAFNVGEVIERERKEMEVEYKYKTNIDIMDCHLLVRNYLEHYGYVRTLESFDRLDNRISEKPDVENDGGRAARGAVSEPGTSGGDAPSFLASSSETIAHVRAMIMSGRAREALELVRTYFPELLRYRNGAVLFALKLQEFIEVLRGGDVQGALRIAREDLAPIRGGDATKDKVMDRAFSLLAFVDPEEGSTESVRGLLRPETRDVVADVFIAAFKSKEREDAQRGPCKRRKGPHRRTMKTGDAAGGGLREVHLDDRGTTRSGEKGGRDERECFEPIQPLHQLLVHLCVVMGEIRNSKQHGHPFAIEKVVD